MHDRVLSPRVLLLIAMALPIAGCTNPLVVSLVGIAHNTISIPSGQTAQFTATGVLRPRTIIPRPRRTSPNGDMDVEPPAVWPRSVPRASRPANRGHNQHHRQHSTDLPETISAIGYTYGTGSTGGGTGRAPLSLAIIPSTQSGDDRGGNSPIPGHWDHFYRGHGQRHQLGSLEFKQPAIATIGATTGLATAVGQGTVHDHRDLYDSGGSTLTSTATFTVGSGRSHRRIYRCHHRSRLPVHLSLGPDWTVHRPCHFGHDRP